MQPVGQLDDDHPDISGHSDKHFAQVFHLGFFFAAVSDFSQTGDAVDQIRHRAAEFLFHHGVGGLGILQHVVKQAGYNGIRVHAQLCQNARHCHRVDKIRLAAAALLALVGRLRIIIGFFNFLYIRERGVLFHFGQQRFQAVIGFVRLRRLGLGRFRFKNFRVHLGFLHL